MKFLRYISISILIIAQISAIFSRSSTKKSKHPQKIPFTSSSHSLSRPTTSTASFSRSPTFPTTPATSPTSSLSRPITSSVSSHPTLAHSNTVTASTFTRPVHVHSPTYVSSRPRYFYSGGYPRWLINRFAVVRYYLDECPTYYHSIDLVEKHYGDCFYKCSRRVCIQIRNYCCYYNRDVYNSFMILRK